MKFAVFKFDKKFDIVGVFTTDEIDAAERRYNSLKDANTPCLLCWLRDDEFEVPPRSAWICHYRIHGWIKCPTLPTVRV